jgi:hypothetical protein
LLKALSPSKGEPDREYSARECKEPRISSFKRVLAFRRVSQRETCSRPGSRVRWALSLSKGRCEPGHGCLSTRLASRDLPFGHELRAQWLKAFGLSVVLLPPPQALSLSKGDYHFRARSFGSKATPNAFGVEEGATPYGLISTFRQRGQGYFGTPQVRILPSSHEG